MDNTVRPVTYALPEESVAIPNPSSRKLPPRYVEYTRAEPAAFSFVTNASEKPGAIVWNAPEVVGKFEENVVPLI